MTQSRNRWLDTVESHAAANRHLLRVWRLINSSVEGFFSNNDLLRASALTYTTALSIVPILALAFSVLKGVGGEDRLRPLIQQYLALGSADTADTLMHFIGNVNGKALGSASGALLLITVITTMGNVETALNSIFRAPQSRSYFRKFSDYLSVLFTVPILMVAALGITAAFSTRASALGLGALTILTPFLFAWGGFFFLYTFFPYTSVNKSAALLGSAAGALLFQIAQWGYVKFQIGAANYHAIYGALASVPMFLAWTYAAWCIVLAGAEVAAAAQRGFEEPPLRPMSPDFPVSAALHILLSLADRQASGDGVITTTSLAHQLGVPRSTLTEVLERLSEKGLIVEASGDSAGLHLVRHPSSIRMAEALAPFFDDDPAAQADKRVASVMQKLDGARAGALDSMTLADLMGPAQPAQDHS